MNFNFIKEFWFKAIIFTFALLAFTTWALSPISHDDLISNQELNIEQLTAATDKIISKNFKKVQNEINYLLTELNSTKSINNLEEIESPVKALFSLNQNENQLELSGNELRSLDLSYWLKEDINKSINRAYKSDDGLFYRGYQLISSPSGENYYGYLFLNESKYYFAILNLHFASSWSLDLNLTNNNIYVINSVGELIYHPEIQYIGTEFNLTDKIIDNFDAETKELHLKNRESLSYVKASNTKDIKVILSQPRWVTPYGWRFYGRFILVFMCLGLLLYTLSEYLVKKSKTRFLNQEVEAAQSLGLENLGYKEFSTEKKRLITKINRLENELASQKEYVSPTEQKQLLHSIKSKTANLVGQIQLLQGYANEDSEELTTSVHSKATEIYKEIFSFLDLKDDRPNDFILKDSLEGPFVGKSVELAKRTIDYEMSSEVSFVGNDDRIEITEEDIGGEELKLFGEVKKSSLISRIESKKNEINEQDIDENIMQQLSEQSYSKNKIFDIEENFLIEQKNETIQLSERNSFNEQMSQIDKIIETTDEKVNKSKNDIKNIIRKPRLTD